MVYNLEVNIGLVLWHKIPSKYKKLKNKYYWNKIHYLFFFSVLKHVLPVSVTYQTYQKNKIENDCGE